MYVHMGSYLYMIFKHTEASLNIYELPSCQYATQ